MITTREYLAGRYGPALRRRLPSLSAASPEEQRTALAQELARLAELDRRAARLRLRERLLDLERKKYVRLEYLLGQAEGCRLTEVRRFLADA